MTTESWGVAVSAIALAVALFWLPGLLVLVAGWRWSPAHLTLAPAFTVALGTVAGTAASAVGIGWSIWPVLGLAVLTAAIAWGVRRWVDTSPAPDEPVGPAPTRSGWWALGAGVVIAAVLMIRLCVIAFVGPGNISQTFDGIVHLNTVQWAHLTGDVSPFHIGATSDAPFYPNGFHIVPTLLLSLLPELSVPVAINAANIALAAFVWPCACIAGAVALLGRRPAVVVGAAVLSTAFGAFPMLMFDFGVLYPNAVGYALIPIGLAWVLRLMDAPGVRRVVREGLGLLVALAGIFLAHPNAFLSLTAFTAPIVVHRLLGWAWRTRTVRSVAVAVAGVGALVAFIVVLWSAARTNEAMSRWPGWQTPAQAFRESLLVAPDELPLSFVLLLVVAAGSVRLARQPRLLPAGYPFAVAAILFTLSSGFEVGHPVREAVTNPWYNDSYRLAALLPIAAIPVVTAGAVACWDAARTWLDRLPAGVRPWSLMVAAAVATAALVGAAQGGNAQAGALRAQQMYLVNDESPVLNAAESELMARLDAETPPDALIAGSPRTGTSLAYALADRDVLRKHVFGQPEPDEQYLDANLRHIDDDPEVCRIVKDLGIDYVLDFGSVDVHGTPDASVWQGMQDLRPSRHLVLVDEQGPGARLFRIEGC